MPRRRTSISSGPPVAQNAAQQAAAGSGSELQTEGVNDDGLVVYAASCDSLQHTVHKFIREVVIQTTLKTPAKSALFDERAAQCAALAGTEPELLLVVQFWPDLPDPIRLAILAGVRSGAGVGFIGRSKPGERVPRTHGGAAVQTVRPGVTARSFPPHTAARDCEPRPNASDPAS
jgi:hypothetical protein